MTFLLESRLNGNLFYRLDLSRNSISEFPKGLPSSLKLIRLIGNKITAITSSVQPTLNNLTQLERLDLDDNLIQVMYDYQITPMTSLIWLGLQYNPIVSHVTS